MRKAQEPEERMSTGYESESEPGIDGDTLSITDFSSGLRVPFAMAVASMRNTGKTLLVSALINELLVTGKVDMVLVMSQTAHVNNDYWFLPARLRQPFNELTIQKLMDHQSRRPKGRRDQVLLVLDDVLSDREAERSRFIKALYTKGRHYDLSVILISQTSNVALSPAIKQNSDYILYSRLNRFQLAVLWEFIRYSETHNKDFTFLCVDNTSQSNRPEDFLLKVRVTDEEAAKISPEESEESDGETSGSEW